MYGYITHSFCANFMYKQISINILQFHFVSYLHCSWNLLFPKRGIFPFMFDISWRKFIRRLQIKVWFYKSTQIVNQSSFRIVQVFPRVFATVWSPLLNVESYFVLPKYIMTWSHGFASTIWEVILHIWIYLFFCKIYIVPCWRGI